MAFELASLFVSIKGDDSPLQKQIGGVRSQLGAVGVAIGTAAGNLLSSAISGASSALTGFVSKGLTGAVALQDTMSATTAVLGESSGAIFKWAEDMASNFGAVKNETIGAALSFAQNFKSIGKSADDAAALGTELAKLGMDLRSFKGGTNQEAFTALQAALRGEFDPLERYNIMLSAAAVQEEAMSMGLVKSAKEMDNNAKKLATLSLIKKGAVDMTGDLERTADQAGNQWAKFSGTITNVATDIGTALMPAITAVLQAGAGLATQLAAAFEGSKATIGAWGESFAKIIRSIPQYWDEFVAGLTVAFLKVDEFAQNFGAVIAVIPTNLMRIGLYIANNWRELIVDGISAVGTAFTNLSENLGRLAAAIFGFLSDPSGGFNFEWQPLLEGFKATAGELPELLKPNLVSMDDAISSVGEDLARKTEARNKAAAQSAQAKTEPAKKAAAEASEKKDKFKAETFSGEDYYAKLRAAAIGGDDDTPKKSLEEQKKTRIAAEKTAAAMDAIPLLGALK